MKSGVIVSTVVAVLLPVVACAPTGSTPSGNQNTTSNENINDNSQDSIPETNVSTIGGTGTAGFGGDGGAATQAMLDSPMGLTVAADGTVYVADYGNHRVRAIDGESGVMSTVVGNGQPTGDGSLFYPTAIAFNRQGELFVSSWMAGQVYRIDSGSTLTLYAGSGVDSCGSNDPTSPATEAALNLPRSVDFLVDGSMLVSEQGCHRIRSIDVNGEMETFAGTGEAGYSGDDGPATEAQFQSIIGDPPVPLFGISVSPEDPPDQLYLADTGNNVIREIRLFSRTIVTLAGDGAAGYVNGPPLQSEFNNPTNTFLSFDHAVWVVDSGNHVIRRVDPFSIAVKTVIGTGEPGFNGDGLLPAETQLNDPRAVFVTRDGYVYVADTGNHRVRKFKFDENG